MSRQFAAGASLVFGVVGLALLTAHVIVDFPRGALGLGLLVLALVCSWQGVVRRGPLRVAGMGAGVLLAVAVAALAMTGHPALLVGAMAAAALAMAGGAFAFRTRVALPRASRPAHPVLVCNPRSGGGKVGRFHLLEEARARGIEVIELTAESDLEELLRHAVDRGADALCVAGGDGSQAIGARIAAERDLPYACIPAGTRNHFALDLGVDRDDVVGALDAFVDGGERRIDLGDVNGRTFVNNVSLGVYGEAVQHAGYRGAKLRTVLETVPDVLGPGVQPDLGWKDDAGELHAGAAAIVVSNNPYRLAGPVGEPTRPHLDTAVLGVVALDERGARTWSTPSFHVDAHAKVPAGVDGEAVMLSPPLRFRVRHAALRCRIARQHPGASPSAFAPDTLRLALRGLVGIASGRHVEAPPAIDDF
jgi:diacylglycerol kinase family enzyme